ncbi:hypothetical protein PM082_022543 [Marasmius tenuissimus]|nr:hypothetical protein PM082_022543 [Marasmius tenuissimus]
MSADFDPSARMATISSEIRNAIRQALPMPADQFLTVVAPGKVLNLDEYAHGFDRNGKPTTPLLPAATELAQARLCDDMPSYGPFQLGPTGRSVARSYGQALSKLVPSGTTVGIATEGSVLTYAQERYKQAMAWLTTLDTRLGKTRVEVYTQKQHAYTKVVEDKARAYACALEKAKKEVADPSDIDAVRAIYDQWVNENARTYRNFTQAAYMDWVITGKKEEVEYYFAIVDQDSAMSRVEQSKEAMRALVVQDPDGAVEHSKVVLEPRCWAVYALNKIADPTDNTRTVEWYTYEITRLRSMNALIAAMREPSPTQEAIEGSVEPEVKSKDKAEAINGPLKVSFEAYFRARESHKQISAKMGLSPLDKEKAYEKYKAAERDMFTALKDNSEAEAQNLAKVALDAQKEMEKGMASTNGVLQQRQEANAELIKQYVNARKLLMQKGSDGGFIDVVAKEMRVGAGRPDPEAPVLPGTQFNTGKSTNGKSVRPAADFFTTISLDVNEASSSASSTLSAESSDSSSSESSYNRWWWQTVEASAQQSGAQSSIQQSMAKSSCKISFECMRVDITRPWMRPELFYDTDLTVPVGQFISPGAFDLKELMEGKKSQEKYEEEMKLYNTFPMYPTAFLLACNTVLEISGETASIQNHFSTSNSTKRSMNYGPFTVSTDQSSTNSSASTKCEATATGCRIIIKSPQIIGWISQIVPALPRLSRDKRNAIIARQEQIASDEYKAEQDRIAAANKAKNAPENKAIASANGNQNPGNGPDTKVTSTADAKDNTLTKDITSAVLSAKK